MTRRGPIAARLLLVGLLGALATFAVVAPPAAADSVGGPNGPELSCLRPMIPSGVNLSCRVDGFEPGEPVTVGIVGRRSSERRLTPDADGSAEFKMSWPYTTSGFHSVLAVQGSGTTQLRSSTNVTSSVERLSSVERRALRRRAATTTGGPAADDEVELAPAPRPEREVSLQVSLGLGLAAVGLGVVFVRHRSRRRLGL